MSHPFVEGAYELHLVSSRTQVLHHLRRETLLQLQRVARLAPGAPEQPARGRDLFLQAAGKDRGLSLGLAVTAHGAVHHDPPVIQHRQCRIEGEEGPAPRPEGIQGSRVEREGAVPVLPADPGLREYQTAAELVVDALDEADRTAGTVDNTEPDGVGRACPCAPGRRPALINRLRHGTH